MLNSLGRELTTFEPHYESTKPGWLELHRGHIVRGYTEENRLKIGSLVDKDDYSICHWVRVGPAMFLLMPLTIECLTCQSPTRYPPEDKHAIR